MIPDSHQGQKVIETHLLRILEQGFSKEQTLEEVFGSYEDWLLRVGSHLLLLHPILKEWLFYDELHDTWESTGYGPSEGFFVTQGKQLGFNKAVDVQERGDEALSSLDPNTTQISLKSLRRCPVCGELNHPAQTVCVHCGAALERD